MLLLAGVTGGDTDAEAGRGATGAAEDVAWPMSSVQDQAVYLSRVVMSIYLVSSTPSQGGDCGLLVK